MWFEALSPPTSISIDDRGHDGICEVSIYKIRQQEFSRRGGWKGEWRYYRVGASVISGLPESVEAV